jgi:hypothetical protein
MTTAAAICKPVRVAGELKTELKTGLAAKYVCNVYILTEGNFRNRNCRTIRRNSTFADFILHYICYMNVNFDSIICLINIDAITGVCNHDTNADNHNDEKPFSVRAFSLLTGRCGGCL